MFSWFKKKKIETHSEQMLKHVFNLDAWLGAGTFTDQQLLIAKFEEQKKSWGGGNPIEKCGPIAQANIRFYQSLIDMIKTRSVYEDFL